MRFVGRLRLSYRLSTLLICIAVIAVVVWEVKRLQDRRRALAIIRASGGMVHFDYEFSSEDELVSNPRSPVPKFLRWAADDDLVCEPVAIEFHSKQLWVPLSPACLESLRSLTALRSLDFGGFEPSDKGLARLDTLVNLRRLDLSDTHVSNAGFEALKPLTNLRSLNLSGTFITAEGLLQLNRSRSLRNCLDSRRITRRSSSFQSSITFVDSTSSSISLTIRGFVLSSLLRRSKISRLSSVNRSPTRCCLAFKGLNVFESSKSTVGP